jgi:hypothetical protein
MQSTREDVGLCWGCGYALRAIESRRCPECGREFDPTDLRSTNRGRVVGKLGRWMLRPVGPGVLAAAGLGMVLIFLTARWPAHWGGPWFMDARFFLRWGNWKERWLTAGWVEAAFTVGVILWIGVLLGWVVGAGLRWMAIRRYRPEVKERAMIRRRHLVLLLMLAVSFALAEMGTEYRLGKSMVHREAAEIAGALPAKSAELDLPAWIDEGERVKALLAVMRHGGSSKERMTGLKMLAEGHHSNAGLLAKIVGRGFDPEMKAWGIRVFSVWASRRDDAVISGALKDESAEVRAAAADGLAVLHDELIDSQTSWLRSSGYGTATTESQPPIVLLNFARNRGGMREGLSPISGQRRGELVKMMTDGPTAAEREAAARALSGSAPDGYQLRLAEWGVWMMGGGNDGALQAVLAENPAFVHQAGDSAAALAKRVDQWTMIVTTKPVIHLTASLPLSVDLRVRINQGRPWCVYPMPDDYEFGIAGGGSAGIGMSVSARVPKATTILTPLDPVGMEGLGTKMHSGYPWLVEKNRAQAVNGGVIEDVGFRWQSLIVSPKKLPWMQATEVGNDARYAWWKGLREVNCSWVCNRGESERFLFYDGPTMLRSPVVFDLKKGELVVHKTKLKQGEHTFGPHFQINSLQNVPVVRDALRVRVHGGQVEGKWTFFSIAMQEGIEEWPANPVERKIEGEEVPAAFFKLLRNHGLNKSEATGMIGSWKMLFSREGERVLMFLNGEDYAQFCPIQIRPAATEMARVGVIWCELKPSAKIE